MRKTDVKNRGKSNIGESATKIGVAAEICVPNIMLMSIVNFRRISAASDADNSYADFLKNSFAQIKDSYETYLADFRGKCQEEHDKVVELGGLAIVGTERHEARRIDNQLRGRAGRQGDPGSSRFYLSLEDDLLRIFGSEKVQGIMSKLGMTEGESIESSMLSKVIESSQHKIEQMYFNRRKQLLSFDNVMNKQREAIYTERQTILQEEDIVDYGWGIIQGITDEMLDRYFPEDEEPDPQRAISRVKAVFGPGTEAAELLGKLDSRAGMEIVREEILDSIKKRYDQKIGELSPETAHGLLRYVVLNTLDDAWRNHLLDMDELLRGIGLRSIGQKDPLIEYQYESYNLFQEMMLRVRESFTEQFFRVKVISETAPRRERKMSEIRDFHLPPAMQRGPASGGDGKLEPFRKTVKIGRNDPCFCGSGKKYKHCCDKSS